jgi:hypothetical protein
MLWIEIKTLPDLGVDVLVFSAAIDIVAIASLEVGEGGDLYWESDSDELAASPADAVSHWMPMPSRPDSVD